MKQLFLLAAVLLLLVACGGAGNEATVKDSVSGNISVKPLTADTLTVVDTGAVRPITPIQ